MDTPLSDTDTTGDGLDRLRQDLMRIPVETEVPADVPADGPADFSDLDPIDYAALEFEVDRMRKRLAIWEIFMDYVRGGARTWPDVQQALTQEDLDQIEVICDGVPLRDVLLHLR